MSAVATINHVIEQLENAISFAKSLKIFLLKQNENTQPKKNGMRHRPSQKNVKKDEVNNLTQSIKNINITPAEYVVNYKNKQRNILVRGVSSKYPHLVDVEDLSTNFLRTYDIQQLKQENPTVQFNF
jgi:hypothetical protein